MKKQCTICKEWKELNVDNFSKHKNNNDGFLGQCKICRIAYGKEWREKNKESLAARKKIYREENKEKVTLGKKTYYHNNKEHIAAKKKVYREENKQKVASRKKLYREKNKERIAMKHKAWYEENKEECAAKGKIRYQENKEQVSDWGKSYRKENKDKIAIRKKIYSEENKDKIAAESKVKRKEKKKEINNRCLDCGKLIKPGSDRCRHCDRMVHGDGRTYNTSIELKIKAELERLSIKFIQQYQYNPNNANHSADFYLPDYNIIVECDGNFWHNLPGRKIRDAKKNEYYKEHGFTLYRFWEHEINKSAADCISRISEIDPATH